MNDERRKLIRKAVELIAEGRAMLEQARDEEQEYHDNMPENLQNGSKGDDASQAIDALETVISELESAESSIEEIAP